MALEDLLVKLFEKHAQRMPAQVTTGTVSDIDLDEYTCTVERTDRPPLFNVRLNSSVYAGGRMVTIPKANSVVLVCMIENDHAEAYLLACGDIDKVLIDIGTTKFEITADGSLIQKGADTLNSILNEMVNQMLEIYAPKNVGGITALKQRIDNLLQ